MFEDLLNPSSDPFLKQKEEEGKELVPEPETQAAAAGSPAWDSGQPQQFWGQGSGDVWNTRDAGDQGIVNPSKKPAPGKNVGAASGQGQGRP